MFVVRHPEVADPLKETEDTPPDAKGKVQAHKVAGFFKGKTVKKIYSSPAKRTRYQADAISRTTGAPVVLDDRLKAWDVRGKSESETDSKIDGAIESPDTAPDSTDETYNDFKHRVTSFHQEHAGDSSVVAVTHSKNIAQHKALATNTPMSAAARVKTRDVKISEIKPTSFKPLLVLKNSASSESKDA